MGIAHCFFLKNNLKFNSIMTERFGTGTSFKSIKTCLIWVKHLYINALGYWKFQHDPYLNIQLNLGAQ